MEPIIVTINRTGESTSLDLLVQPDVPISQLSTFIAEGLTWNTDFQGHLKTYEVEAIPPGRILDAQETLADAHVGNGARLIFHPNLISKTASVDEPLTEIDINRDEIQAPSESPVIGRRKLHSPVKTDKPEVERREDTDGYVLMQIDED